MNSGLGAGGASQAFTWLLNLSTVAGLIAWATLCVCYIRFHSALKAQDVNRDSLPWKSPFQPYTAWIGFVGSSIFTLVVGFPVFLKGNWSTADFIASYIGIPIFIVPIIAWKLVYKTKVRLGLIPKLLKALTNAFPLQFARSKAIDVWSGRFYQEKEPVHKEHKPASRAVRRFFDWLI